MTLLEFNNTVLYGEKTVCKVPAIDNDMLVQFKKMLAISNMIKSVFDNTDDANSFFAVFPDIKSVAGSSTCVELFYACKLGYWYPGIPSKLVYVLTIAFRECGKEYANKAINSCLNLIKSYANCSWEVDGETLTVKDVIENITGKSVDLITDSVRKVDTGNGWEVFVPNIAQVILLPLCIAEMLSYTDCEKLEFTKDLGVSLNGIPLRTLNGFIGIVRDDFDLRDCF